MRRRIWFAIPLAVLALARPSAASETRRYDLAAGAAARSYVLSLLGLFNTLAPSVATPERSVGAVVFPASSVTGPTVRVTVRDELSAAAPAIACQDADGDGACRGRAEPITTLCGAGNVYGLEEGRPLVVHVLSAGFGLCGEGVVAFGFRGYVSIDPAG